jgi:tRNA nucleotidyltransferase (CCA-adding enzyme)
VAQLAKDVEDVRRSRPPLTAADLALDGRAIMQVLTSGPGPHIGEALRHLLDRVLADPGMNTRDRLAEEVRRWWAARGTRL